MSKRKPNNMRVRMERSCRALLSTNHVAVVQIDPSNRQGMINWVNCKSIPPGQRLADAVCDIPHRWTIYLSVQCCDQRGYRYTKSVEVAPQGNYLAAHLEDVIEDTYKDLIAESNPNHRVASGWIAIPAAVSLTEEQAARVFDAVGAWNQQRAA
ncbi:hypothetical protein D3X12_24295 [Pseudomonas protegens]|uniref:Uncharacterized protein n=2 Tax=Pseudomonas protegens TaxID=380021 RepID=F9XXD4_PSEF5|nr:hypothetical protein [Pseudomonas protegens]AEK81726.1 Hypothetical protein PFL_6254 [Pseudomonas protegens Pf-5]ASE22762.1 hypothetical protein CEP86_20640 [Pseudomonas protegens]QEZ53551.1 hypothetical protein D3X12_24295 [Pseudomonas protegens]QEZ60242.1 hypothetical protein D4N38_27520 [Pseudomonas protegens]QEZ64842.1 hypothetical protein D4N37_19625 [Pseudomonas protegens]